VGDDREAAHPLVLERECRCGRRLDGGVPGHLVDLLRELSRDLFSLRAERYRRHRSVSAVIRRAIDGYLNSPSGCGLTLDDLRDDNEGERQTAGSFPTRSAAFTHYRNVIEPKLRGEERAPESTLSEFVDVYLERHAAGARTRTIRSLRQRLGYATRDYGTVPLRELERMTNEIAGWQTRLPNRSRYGIVSVLRQTLEAPVRWGYMTRHPAKLAGRNPQPPQRPVRAFTLAEVDAIAAELSTMYGTLPAFVAATGLRLEEWAALERRDIDRRGAIVNVRRTVSDGEVLDLGKTSKSRRQVALSRRATCELHKERFCRDGLVLLSWPCVPQGRSPNEPEGVTPMKDADKDEKTARAGHCGHRGRTHGRRSRSERRQGHIRRGLDRCGDH
jgi:integrase